MILGLEKVINGVSPLSLSSLSPPDSGHCCSSSSGHQKVQAGAPRRLQPYRTKCRSIRLSGSRAGLRQHPPELLVTRGRVLPSTAAVEIITSHLQFDENVIFPRSSAAFPPSVLLNASGWAALLVSLVPLVPRVCPRPLGSSSLPPAAAFWAGFAEGVQFSSRAALFLRQRALPGFLLPRVQLAAVVECYINNMIN